MKQACTRLHLPEAKLPLREVERLQRYDWPGNVRELQNVVERAVILARGGPLQFQLDGASRTQVRSRKTRAVHGVFYGKPMEGDGAGKSPEGPQAGWRPGVW